MHLLPLAAIVALSAPQTPPPAPIFYVASFFNGRTEGAGQLRKMFGKRQPVRVRGRGRLEADGTLVLDQTVERPGMPSKDRQWRIRETSPGRYTGTLSDATGPVTGVVTGNRLQLSFRMKGGLDAQQALTLAPDGRSAHNILTVRKFGMVVATLDETITRLDVATPDAG